MNQLSDPGFEGELGQKLTNFANFNASGFWLDDGVNYTNTGYEATGAHSGVERAYEMSGDDGAFQISSYAMNNGDLISLTWWGLATSDPSTGNTNPPEQVVGLISCPSSTPASGPAGFATCSPLTVTSNGLTGTWVQYTLNYTAESSDVGKYIGCFFNTTNAFGFVTNSFGGYDDFFLAVLPAGSKPSITVEPVSQTAYTHSSVSFAVGAVGATSYQWMAGATGGGIYTNLSNGGQISGVTTANLTITNLSSTNNGDYVVVVSNGNGSVTSAPPANLTVQSIIYQETFYMPKQNDQMVTNVGWIQDIGGSYGPARIFSGNNNHGVTFPVCAVYTYDNTAVQTNAYYYTTTSANGGPYDLLPGDGLGPVTNKQAFPGINLAVVQNLSYSVMANNGPGASEQVYWAVQMNHGQWYVSTNYFVNASGNAFQTYTMNFNPAASGWNLLTVSGHCTFTSLNTNVVIGPAASSPLTGYVTGGGFVPVFTASGGNVQFNNYAVLGAIPPTLLPVINAPPVTQTNYTGTAATFTVSATTNGLTTGLTYLWMAGTVGSGLYTPLSNGGQFSGVTTPNLTISNVANPGNHQDYVVVVTDGAGSVTSTPPATLWIADSLPILQSDNFINPDNAKDLGNNTGLTITAGNHNVINLSATFVGDLPMTYQWQTSATNNGTGVTSVGGNASTLTLSNPQTNASGYYRLSAVNSQGGPVYSSWVLLTVNPASSALVTWSAKVSLNGLTAAQILGGVSGSFFEAETFGGATLSVTNGTNVFLFDSTGVSATLTGGYTTRTGGFIGDTGDTNLNTILGGNTEGNSGQAVTLNGLTVSNLYSAQFFAFNDVAATGRQGNFADTNNLADVSQSFAMGDNVYVVGTFVATNSTETIGLEGDSGCYMTCVIVRNAMLAPTVSIQKVGSSVQVTYANGVLEQATNVKGPWTTNSTPSPYTLPPTGTSVFFRAVQ
ncbi:MAG: immunoglobulin domain-containing protein [Verrucomicrobiota bacterium]